MVRDDSSVSDRLSKRFDDEDDTETEESEPEQDSTNDMNSGASSTSGTSSTSMKSRNSMKPQTSKNVKKDWNATTVYLPDDLDGRLSTTYKRTDLEVSEGSELSLKKTRHYYPLVVALGLERLESMEVNEVMEVLDNLSV